MDLGPSERTPTSDGSVTLKFVEDRPSGEKEDVEIEASPVLSTPDLDDYPDGGLAAWSIVLGVSPSTIIFRGSVMRSGHIVYICCLLDVCCTP